MPVGVGTLAKESAGATEPVVVVPVVRVVVVPVSAAEVVWVIVVPGTAAQHAPMSTTPHPVAAHGNEICLFWRTFRPTANHFANFLNPLGKKLVLPQTEQLHIYGQTDLKAQLFENDVNAL